MNEYFIKNIEIKNFKCFEDFKAEGFGRVNLIGGKNNVGKTAFMEACFLGENTKTKEERLFFHALLVIELNRRPLEEFKIIENSNNFEFKYEDSLIKINNINCSVDEFDDKLYSVPNKNYKIGIHCITDFYQGDNKPLNIQNHSFISQISIRDNYLKDSIDEIKFLKKWKELNGFLLDNFNIEEIDVIKNRIFLFQNDNHILLSEFGDGIKQFIAIILSLYLNKDSVIFLDEIENGIHYSLLDNLWEIILTISKEQNVQVFATTHSKECIESYARVAKKLEDEEITYSVLTKLRSGKLLHSLYDNELLETAVIKQ